MEFEDQQHSGGNGTGPSYDSLSNSNSAHPRMPEDDDNNGGGGGGDLPVTEPPLQMRKPRYRECQKNHAVGIGGHAVDGCGEFMPAGEYGTLDALKCAACNCHRNFHRKEINTAAALIPVGYHPHHHHRAPSGYLHHHHHHHHAPLQRPLALPSISGSAYREEMEELDLDMDTATPNSGGGGSKGKRFRTKFTEVQKEKMVELAERLGWRIQKENEEAVEQFCNEYGVRRHVFKVWMHNNKHTVAKKTLEQNNNNNTNHPDQDPPRI